MKGSQAGKLFEGTVRDKLFGTAIIHKGWSYRLNDKVNFKGRFVSKETPADHLYLSEDINLLIECKVVWQGDRFVTSRVSENQRESLKGFTNISDKHLGAVVFSFWQPRQRGPVYLLPSWELDNFPKHIKREEVRRNPRALYIGLTARALTKRKLNQIKKLRKEYDGNLSL